MLASRALPLLPGPASKGARMKTVDSVATDLPTGTRREREFAGLTSKGVAIVVGICAINALRRCLTLPELRNAPLEWLLRLASTFLGSLMLAIPVVVAVLVAYNRL